MSRWNGTRYSGSGGGGGGGGGGTSSPSITDAENNTGAALAAGSLVAVESTGPKRVQLLNTTTASAETARYLGVVGAAGIADAATGEVILVGEATVKVKAGLAAAPADGDELYGSTTAGEATTLADLVANPPAAGAAIYRIGLVLNAALYGGASTVVAAVHSGQRREV